MRVRIIKAVCAAALAASIAGPALAVAVASGGNTASPSASTSGCPTGASVHTGASYAQDKDHLVPVRLKGTNQCYTGIQVKGNFPTDKTWWDLKQCCNGTGVTIASGAVPLVKPRTNNIAVDGIRTWNHAKTTLNTAWETNTRDD